MGVSKRELIEALRRSDLSHRPVCVHCSLRSFGYLDGGAQAILDAFLDEGATLVVPTFSWGFSVPAPEDDRPSRNGTDYRYTTPALTPEVYSPRSMTVDRDMGALSAAVVAHPDRLRGAHPICSFSAVGTAAAEFISPQSPKAVWAPLEELSERGGAVVLMGVGLTRLTLAHLAELRAGRRPFIRWALDSGGTVSRARVGSCSDGFGDLSSAIAKAARLQVGSSEWTILPAASALTALATLIEDRPDLTRCDDPDCPRCRDAVLGGPLE